MLTTTMLAASALTIHAGMLKAVPSARRIM
jgi:hypothetical protein